MIVQMARFVAMMVRLDTAPRVASNPECITTRLTNQVRGYDSNRSRLLELVDLVVERLEADAELLGGGGLVAVVLLEDGLDVAHLDVAEGRGALGDGEMG